jgi:hypothetical protein
MKLQTSTPKLLFLINKAESAAQKANRDQNLMVFETGIDHGTHYFSTGAGRTRDIKADPI